MSTCRASVSKNPALQAGFFHDFFSLFYAAIDRLSDQHSELAHEALADRSA